MPEHLHNNTVARVITKWNTCAIVNNRLITLNWICILTIHYSSKTCDKYASTFRFAALIFL